MKDAELEPALKTPRAEFGIYLREYRMTAGRRQKELAAMLGWSVSKISMVERGQRTADEAFARAADTALGAEGGLLARWRETVEHSSRWPVWLARLAEIEQEAATLRLWQPLIVPGMLQTPEYARAIFRGKPATTSEEVEQNVAARMERQRVLQRDNGPTAWVILDEVVLNRPIGSEAVMAEQMAHLVALDEHPRINVRVLPRDSWLTTGLQGAFVLADGPGMPDMAYLESITLSQITADSGRVREIKSRYEMLHNEALPRRASLQLMGKMAEQWTT
ncbi:helix-turn-helix domain-containing protein [Nonomuraea glycinis]|uniref:Transcriptional regulator n=1 Tax=Nonomuraea glycinis TaxID=2047744 RepID=A0A918E2D9_9ACTN|nr:helix-turn-helix transcriptional regulator [Nonomuraea glycinis]MCA2174771.1 helix-turn-helix domain-containing protein [Nonomuraea glycinis]GGP01701.1 transcriptional regulator [Nonomuraea glycinis]